MKTLTDAFRTEVEDFLARSGWKPTEFGRLATGDPSFVRTLRHGRSVTLDTADRVLAFIRAQVIPAPHPEAITAGKGLPFSRRLGKARCPSLGEGP